MGRITPKITRYWLKESLEFLKNNWKLNNREIGRIINKHPQAVSVKRKALGLPFRECDVTPLSFFQKQLIFGSLLGDGSIVKEKSEYRLSTACFSKKEVKLLIKWLKKAFSIESSLRKHGKYWYIAIQKDRWKFTKLVKSYLSKGLNYKLFNLS